MGGGLVGLALLAAFLYWLLRGKAQPQTVPEDLNYEEREAREELRLAEEEVREIESDAQPDEEKPGDDWGPGTAQSYR